MNQTRMQILNIYSSKNHVEMLGRNNIIETEIKTKITLGNNTNSQKRASLHEASKFKDQNPTPERIKNFKLLQL